MSGATAVAVGADAPIPEVMADGAMRRLHRDPIPRATLTRLLEAATWPPSGNSRDYAFLVVDGRERIAALGPIWRPIVDHYLATRLRPSTCQPNTGTGCSQRSATKPSTSRSSPP